MLAWVAAATLVTNVFLPLMVVLARQRVVLLATAIGLGVNVVLNLVLIPHLGAIGAAYATLATEIAVTAPLVAVTITTIHVRLYSRPMIAAILATGAALLTYFAAPSVIAIHWAVGVLALLVWGLVLFVVAPGWIAGQIAAVRFRQSGGLAPALAPAEPHAATSAGDH